MMFTEFLGILIFGPAFIFVSFYGVIAVYRIFDNYI